MILDVIVEDKKKRLKEHKARTSEEQMKEPVSYTHLYIYGLRTRIECEPGGEHSTRSDRVTNIG